MSRLLPLTSLLLLLGHASAADPADAALAAIADANAARIALATESAAWTAERERLEASLAATTVERERLEGAAAEATSAADAHAAALAELDDASNLSAIRRETGRRAGALRERLDTLRRGLPPGAVPDAAVGVDGIDALDAVVAVLAAAERGAGSVSIDIIAGQLDGSQRAVKLLRVAAAGAWWSGLDGDLAGTATMLDGQLVLEAHPDPTVVAVIQQAIAIVEGRAPAALLELPFVPLVTMTEAQP
jgi:hypothetical protein